MPEPVNKIIPAQDPVSLTGALSEGSEIAIGPDIAITDEEDSIGSSISHNNEIVDDANISSDSCTESLSDEEISNDDSSEPVDSDKEMNNDGSSEPDDPYFQLKNLFNPIYEDASVTYCVELSVLWNSNVPVVCRSQLLKSSYVYYSYSVHLITLYLRP